MSDRSPPTADHLLDLLGRTMAPEYWRMVIADPALFAIHRGMAEMFAFEARRIHKMAMATEYLPFGDEEEEVATFARRSTCEVDLHRSRDTFRGLTMNAGSVWIAGPQGRRYRNASTITWQPYVAADQRVVFEAEHAGWTWDLDFMADSDGLITKPQATTAVPWLDRINLQDEAVRAGEGASIVLTSGPARLVDAGGGDVLNAGDVGRYVLITDAVNAANVRRVVRIVGHERASSDDPPGSGLRPNTVTLDDAAEPSVLQAAIASDGGVFSNETGGPYTLLPAVPAAADAYYFGLHTRFVRLDFDLETAASGDLEIIWEQWAGLIWRAVPAINDGTVGFTQPGRVEWEMPLTWVSTAIDGETAYWVRARVVSASGATGAVASAVYAGVPFGLVAEEGSVSWQVLRWQDLGFEISRITAPTGGRDDTLTLLGSERKVHPVSGESVEAFRQRAARMLDAVSPVALHTALNRVLSPFGLRGKVMDVQTDGLGGPGFKGMFADTPVEWAPDFVAAADLYEPGDAYPTDASMLPIAAWESALHFWAHVPPSGLGDFGAAADDGPQLLLASGELLVSAADIGVADGFPVTARAMYLAAWQALQRLKLWGVTVTFVEDESLLTPC